MPQQPASRSTTVAPGIASQQLHRRRQQSHRFLMAVPMEQDLRWPFAQRQVELRGELLEQHARLPRLAWLLPAARRAAARACLPSLRKDSSAPGTESFRRAPPDGCSASASCRGVLPCLRQQALRDQGPSAASRLNHVDAEAAALQHLHRGDADFRMVVIEKGVVEERTQRVA